MQSVQSYQLGQHAAARVTFIQLMPRDFIPNSLQQSDQKCQLKISPPPRFLASLSWQVAHQCFV